MPPKIRQLERRLLRAGFTRVEGKGSHRKYRHPNGAKITLSGPAGGDARPYQVKLVTAALEEVKP